MENFVPSTLAETLNFESLSRMFSGDQRLGIGFLTLVATQKGDKFFPLLGVDATALHEIVHEALVRGEASWVHALADQCSFSPDGFAEAVASAYERAQQAGVLASWRPGYHHWIEIHSNSSQAAAAWMRSPGLELDSDRFWAQVEATSEEWGDPKSLAVLKERAAYFSRVGTIPSDAAKSLHRSGYQAIWDGIVQAESWAAGLDLLFSLDEWSKDAVNALSPEDVTPCAEIAALALSDLAERRPSSKILLALSCLGMLAPRSAERLAKARLGSMVNLNELGGRLPEPLARGESPLSWVAQSSFGRSAQIPDIRIPLHEAMGQWKSHAGKALASAVGAEASPNTIEIFKTLSVLPNYRQGSAEHLAIIENLQLLASLAPAEFKKKPSLRI